MSDLTRQAHLRFLEMAAHHARNSNDPSTKVGVVLVAPRNLVLMAGFNSFARGIRETPERLADREMKLELMVHAEMNAILAAARAGLKVEGATLYLAATDKSGAVWGGAPCTRCTIQCIQAGIAAVVTYPFKDTPSRWAKDIGFARGVLIEAGLGYEEIEP